MFGKSSKSGAAPSETTALTETVAKAAASQAVNEAKGLVGKVMTKENLENVSKVAAERFDELSTSLIKGDTSIRVMAIIAGAAIVFWGFSTFLGLIFGLNFNGAVMQLYTIVLALLMLVLEVPMLSSKVPDEKKEMLYKYCLFLKYIWGRGIVLFVSGTLQFAEGGIVNWCIGGWAMFVGVIYFAVGRSSAKKLSTLKHNMFSDSTLKSKYDKVDSKKKGKISLEEFGNLCEDLDLDLTKREKEAIFFHLDSSDDNLLTFDEFSAWWKNYDASFSV